LGHLIVAFEFDKGSKKLYKSPEGIPLDEWAFSCGGLPKCVELVGEIMETGEIIGYASGRADDIKRSAIIDAFFF
jgi:hypothetical protein